MTGERSAAVAAAEAIIARAHRCVPELILLFENGLAKRSRTIIQRPLRAAPQCENSSKISHDDDKEEDYELLDQVLGGFQEVLSTQADQAGRLERGRKEQSSQGLLPEDQDIAVFKGECGEWIYVHRSITFPPTTAPAPAPAATEPLTLTPTHTQAPPQDAVAATLACCASSARAAENCTSTELEAIAKLDSVLENNAECAHLNSLIADEVTVAQVCADTDCIKIVKKAASQAPDCLVDGEDAKRVSLVAFQSCSAPTGSGSSSGTVTTPSPSPTPEVTSKASSSASSVASDSDATTVSTPAPTTAAPSSSGVKTTATSTVVVSSAAAVLLFAAWM